MRAFLTIGVSHGFEMGDLVKLSGSGRLFRVVEVSWDGVRVERLGFFEDLWVGIKGALIAVVRWATSLGRGER